MNTDVKRHGRGRAVIIDPATPPAEWPFAGEWSYNLQLYDSATILAQLVRRDPENRPWHLAIAYVEFENNGGAAVATPTPGLAEGRSYFDALELSSTRDYLRVPVVYTQLTSSDDDLYPDGDVVTFRAHTAGSVGVHGKAFSSDQQSRVYGLSLVASPAPTDPTQDLVYARLYYESSNQFIKAATTQIGLEYQLPFTL